MIPGRQYRSVPSVHFLSIIIISLIVTSSVTWPVFGRSFVPPPAQERSITFTEAGMRFSVVVKPFKSGGYMATVKRFLRDSLVSTHAALLPYPVYQMQAGDIDGDGKQDVCIGVIKQTHFDPVVKKRLFIYRLDEGTLRPLWLGSRLWNALQSFKIVHRGHEDHIAAVEQCSTGRFIDAEYRWKGFGLVRIAQSKERIQQ
jgi:hypothetical protein